MKDNWIKRLCQAEAGSADVLQGNIAFAVGCVRAGLHCADGYPGTPSTEVIDKGLSQVQDMIKVGWSVNEAVAAGVGFGQTLAGRDTVVTMKIPGLFQAADVFTSSSFFYAERGALVYYIASDFVPNSTQHVIDPRPLIKSCCLPILEPRNHQEMLEAPGLAADLSRQFKTPVVVLASGNLCHSEGLVRLNPIQVREPIKDPLQNITKFNLLPVVARVNYDTVMKERMPALSAFVAGSGLNVWEKKSGKTGVITYGANEAFVREAMQLGGQEWDILSLGITHPLPKQLIKDFHASIDGPVYVIEDGYRYVQEEAMALGLAVQGKEEFSLTTEWSPALIAEKLGAKVERNAIEVKPVPRPPMICAGCPYRLFGGEIAKMKKRGKLAAAFGDIGCNTLLYFMGALDTGLAMGASESKRAGFVQALPEMADKCVSILGDSTECHSGLDSTRNSVFRNTPGVKVILDNSWTAMTGGQPAPSSPVNLAGEAHNFDLVKAVQGTGVKTLVVDAYDKKDVQGSLKDAFKLAGEGEFVTMIVKGTCIRKVPREKMGKRYKVDEEACKKCGACLICPGIEDRGDGVPQFTNLCSGCAGSKPACMQMCPTGAIQPLEEEAGQSATKVELAEPPAYEVKKPAPEDLPAKLAVAIRGVGGQGNLFFGKVLTILAFLAGYGEQNIVKGETHGMAQMGGPVISTFSCGQVYSPVLAPKSADCVISMEKSEILRPGFLEMLKDGGTVLMAKTAIVPPVIKAEDYPGDKDLEAALAGFQVMQIDVLAKAFELGDASGRVANVVMMGAMSKLKPFASLDETLWLEALRKVSPKKEIWVANYNAFKAGQSMI